MDVPIVAEDLVHLTEFPSNSEFSHLNHSAYNSNSHA